MVDTKTATLNVADVFSVSGLTKKTQTSVLARARASTPPRKRWH